MGKGRQRADPKTEFGRVLYDYLDSQGMGNWEFAKKVGLSGSVLYRWAVSGDLPTLCDFIKLELILPMSVSEKLYDIVRQEVLNDGK